MSNISNFNNFWHQNISHNFFCVGFRGGVNFFFIYTNSDHIFKIQIFQKILKKGLKHNFVYFLHVIKHICTKYFTCIFIASTIYIHISEHCHMVEVTIDGWSYHELRYSVTEGGRGLKNYDAWQWKEGPGSERPPIV